MLVRIRALGDNLRRIALAAETIGAARVAVSLSQFSAMIAEFDSARVRLELAEGQPVVIRGDGEKLALLMPLTWKFHTDGGVASSPAVAGGMVYIGSDDHHVYALDQESGVLKWKFKSGSRVSSSPAVSGGLVYFGSFDGNFYALDGASGQCSPM